MVQSRNSRKNRKFSHTKIQLPIIGDSFIGSPLWSTQSSTIARKMWSAVAVGKPYFTNPEKNQYPIERYSSGDPTQTMKGKEGTPLMGLNTIRLSGSTLDHFNTQLVQPEERNVVNINRQFERQSKEGDRVAILEQLANIQHIIERRRARMKESDASVVVRDDYLTDDHVTGSPMPKRVTAKVTARNTKTENQNGQKPKSSAPPRPSSKQSFVTLQQMKISSRTPKRLSQTKSETRTNDIDFGLGSLRITSKPKSTPMTVLGPLKRDRLICSCSSCTERKMEKQKVGNDKSERLRILQEQQKYMDPIRGATDAFIHRIRELKSYDLDTAKQEQSESKRKKKKKI
jgi:hypothetical protein